MRANGIQGEGGVAVSEALRSEALRDVETLMMGDNMIGVEGTMALAAALGTAGCGLQLQVLELRVNG